MNIFEKANNQLENFIQNNLFSYNKLRNYDYGTQNRSNVSQISKYTSHRILYEYDILKKLKSTDKHKKFTDEILWRIYWRGYLENHKIIWNEYKNFKDLSYDSSVLKNAINGETGIDCFDNWLQELIENNYLHNHARMWFASIWIFKLKLPWKLGANLFMKHLLDGDAATNTLSWRWVAGMHTNNRAYIATDGNISKYTNNRFRKFSNKISDKIIIKSKTNTHRANKLPLQNKSSDNNILLMFDNDLNIKDRSRLFESYKKVYILYNEIIENNVTLCKNVSHFKKDLILNIHKSISNSEIIYPIELDIFLKDLKSIDVIYPGIGNNLDLINIYSNQKKININYIYRDEDLVFWNHSRSGYYKFKNSFYKMENI